MNVEKYTEEHPASLVGEHVRGEAVVTSGEGQVPSGCVMSMCATLVHPPVVLLQRVRFIAQYLGGGGRGCLGVKAKIAEKRQWDGQGSPPRQ